MGTEEEAERVVRRFCAAVDGRAAEPLRPFFTDDVVYHNIPVDPAVGVDDAIAFIDGFFAMCESMTIEMVNLAVRGNVVLTERIDVFTVGGVETPLAVMGAFEVRDGRISAWRDYFDMGQAMAIFAGGA